MRKRGAALLLAAALAVTGLAGCGASSGETASGGEKVRLMVWSPQNDQSKDNGEWLQTMCEAFAEEHPEWDITFVYGVADEASAAGQVSQDPEASADVFMFANDTLTTLTDASALAKFGGKYREEIESMNTPEVLDSLIMDEDLYGFLLPPIPGSCTMTRAFFLKRIFRIWIPCWRRAWFPSPSPIPGICRPFIWETAARCSGTERMKRPAWISADRRLWM